MTLSGGEKEMDVRVSVVEPICLQLLRSSLSGPAMVVVVADRMWEDDRPCAQTQGGTARPTRRRPPPPTLRR